MSEIEKITFDYLISIRDNGATITDTCDGCQLWELDNGDEYVVLSDNTVITREEDLNDGDPMFPL